MKKLWISILLVLVCIFLSIFFINFFKGKKILVLTGGTLIDGTGKSPLTNSVIVIEKNKIKAISEEGKYRPPMFAKTIDIRGKFIIPGLIDMHVHYTDEAFSDLFLLNGVTSVRDMGNDPEFILSLRDKINAGIVQGPTIFASSFIINNRKIPFGASEYTIVARNPKEAKKIVSDLAKKNVDWIKIYITLPEEMVRTIIKEAEKNKIPVAGHLRRVNARIAAQLGIRTLEHATGIAEALLGEEKFEDAPFLWTISDKTWLHVDKEKYYDLIDLFIRKNIYIVANLTLYQSFVSDGEELKNNPNAKLMSKSIQDGWKRYISSRFLDVTRDKENWRVTKQRLEEFLLLFKERGGKILTGTDTPWPFLVPGFSLHKELKLLVKAGLSPLEALMSATKYSAEALNQEQNLGTIEEGKIADLLILNEDPLEDISHTQNIELIIKSGKIINRKELYLSIIEKQKKEE
ncbi:MAG: amidohydrolase family protein [Candidatus Aminicenantes bacterium]|nr:amidohydrolase family protein [Candidatus Aminicenantes bacterium]